MTTGRINQVSAYHRWLTEAQVKHQQLSVREGIHTKGSDRTNQAPVTETSAPTRGSPLHRPRQATKLDKCKLQRPILAWKTDTDAADFTTPDATQQVQTHKPKPNANTSSRHPPSTLSVTCKRHRMPLLQGCNSVNHSCGAAWSPINLGMHFAIPVSASGCNFHAKTTTGYDFANPVILTMCFSG